MSGGAINPHQDSTDHHDASAASRRAPGKGWLVVVGIAVVVVVLGVVVVARRDSGRPTAIEVAHTLHAAGLPVSDVEEASGEDDRYGSSSDDRLSQATVVIGGFEAYIDVWGSDDALNEQLDRDGNAAVREDHVRADANCNAIRVGFVADDGTELQEMLPTIEQTQALLRAEYGPCD